MKRTLAAVAVITALCSGGAFAQSSPPAKAAPKAAAKAVPSGRRFAPTRRCIRKLNSTCC